jgi:cell division topological specificity factor
MSLFHFLRRGSAPIARERLKILLAHDRIECSHSDLLSVLREEIFAVIGRHVSFEPENVRIRLGRCNSTSTLAVDIEIPSGCQQSDVVLRPNRATFDSGRDNNVSTTNQWVI